MISAGLDIGTNTILMVIAEVHEDGSYTVLHDEHAIPRLGQGVDAAGAISDEAVERALGVLTEYRAILDEAGSPPTLCVGTSALRDASNRDSVVERLGAVINAPIWVIDGSAEAELTFVGTVGTHAPEAVVIDIGGGSTEFVKGAYGKIASSASLNIGALRLAERFLGDRPASPDMIRAMVEAINGEMERHLPWLHRAGVDTYAVAGTPVALASLSLGLERYDRTALEGYRLTFAEVEQHANHLLSLGIDALRSLPGISANRADILPAGAQLLAQAMKFMDLDHVTVSTQGLRFGIMRVAAAETT
jgi:exopolyphosphatase / guanosine-5'-triphosphate,3'-diphosphate pyrophosphatase